MRLRAARQVPGRPGVAEITRRLLHLQKDNSRKGSVDHDEEAFQKALLAGKCDELFLKNIALGAQTLMFVNVSWMMVQLFAAIVSLRSSKCLEGKSAVSEQAVLIGDALEFCFLLLSLPIMWYVSRNPSAKLYFPFIAIYYVYILLYSLPPFSHSCEELRALAACDDGLPKDKILSFNMDCGLQGHTVVQLMMAWILLSPRIIPDQRIMHAFNWTWIFGVYVGLTLMVRDRFDKTHDFYDVVVVLILLSVVNCIAISKKFYIEKGQRSKLVSDLQKREESKKMYNILEYMVPQHLIPRMLKDPGKVICDPIERVSIMFIMFVDFDHTARRLTAAQLLNFLNRYFTLFDQICAQNQVTKIETVGEEYVCAVGVVPDDQKEAHELVLGRLIKVAQELIKLQQQDREVVLRMGIHTGPIVAGVIGHKLPRFRLFGDTINTAARMMQKGRPGELQFGQETFECLPEWVPRKERGPIEMKGKGQVMTYLLDCDNLELSKDPPPAESAPRRGSLRRSLTNQLLELSSQAPATLASHDEEEHDARRRLLDSSPARLAEVELTQMSAPPAGQLESRREPSTRSTSGHPEDLRRASISPSVADPQATGRSRGMSLHDDSLQKFEEVLQEVGKAEEDGGEDGAKRSWMTKFGLRIDVFPGEMEHEFIRWFHKESICKKLDARLDKQALAMSVLTAIEMTYAVLTTDGLNQKSWYAAVYRMPVFLMCRFTGFLIICAWRCVAGAKGWVESAPHEAQRRLVISYCVIAGLMFFSYDALTVSQKWVEARSEQALPKDAHLGEGGMFSLVFVPAYMLVSTQHPFLFVPSVCFIVLAGGLMLLSKQDAWFGISNMFFSNTGMIIFIGNTILNTFLSHTAEQSLRSRYKARHAVMHTRERVETILNTLMPVMVVAELQKQLAGSVPPSHQYWHATIAQSDLCGFTKLASTRKPEEVVEFIGELFGLFDQLTDHYEVYKVETVGDAYIAGQAESPLTEKQIPLNVLLFGLDMVRATHEWSRMRGTAVSCRVGVHHGQCIGGIVGTEMQRYHLFGELMTGLEVLESTAPEGKVQISQACQRAVEEHIRQNNIEQHGIFFEKRADLHLMTSKGEVHDYDEVGGPTFVVRSYRGGL